ncbi:MAG: hypothetical protein WD022_05005, partial [Balneolaceae bacterium]
MILSVFMLIAGCSSKEKKAKSITWNIDNTGEIGGLKPNVLGEPEAVDFEGGKALAFDGKDDGLILPVNPVDSWEQFTVEVLFLPA